MKHKVFDQPKPVYSYEGEAKSIKKKILASRHISGSNDKTRKAKRQIVLPRPFLIKHKHNDSYCNICADYINRLQAWRNKKK